MKKYKLLIESPHMPKGTIVEFDANKRNYVLVLNGIINFSPKQVENRPEVWELVEESTIDKTEQGNVYLPFEPGSGEDYCIVDYKGMADMRKNLNQEIGEKHAKQGAFRTEEAAKMEALRRESMSKRWKPEEGDEYWYFLFNDNIACKSVWDNYNTGKGQFFMGNTHKTEEEALEWGKMYSEAWKVLL